MSTIAWKDGRALYQPGQNWLNACVYGDSIQRSQFRAGWLAGESEHVKNMPPVNEKLESAMRNLRLAIGADNANAVRDLIEALTERRQ